jgi:hypothetical protein
MNPPLDSYEGFTSGWWLYKIQDYQNIHVTTCELENTAAGKYSETRSGNDNLRRPRVQERSRAARCSLKALREAEMFD